MYKKWHDQQKNDLILALLWQLLVLLQQFSFSQNQKYQFLHSKMQQTLHYKWQYSVNNFYSNLSG